MFRENDYQAMNILKEENRENILNALGLFEKKKIISVQEKLTAKSALLTDKKKLEPLCVPQTPLVSRRSQRIYTKSVDDFGNNVVSKITNPYSAAKVFQVHFRKKSLPNTYGCVKGVSIGDTWRTRVECSHAGVHRPTVAGIHPGKEGAYSVAISGDYEDDQDNGYCFTYTGSGGRDLTVKNLRTAPQTRDQTLDGANASLIRNIETRNPVRVIRGYKLDSPFAPEKGYRYDGLYTVEKYWTCIGKSGFRVYKFLMKRCANQAPAPWHKGLKIPRNRIKIVKLRKKKPMPLNTVLNLSGKLTMDEENSGKVTTCQLSRMQLKLNTDVDDNVTIGSSAIFVNRECEIQLDHDETIDYQHKDNTSKSGNEGCSGTCIIRCNKRLADESNKENNKVIIKTRWRRSRMSLPNLKNRTSLPEPSNSGQKPKKRQYKKRLSCPDKAAKKSTTSKRTQYKTPPSIAYFKASNERSFKWSLFASQSEIRRYQKHLQKVNAKLAKTSGDDFEGEFRGFERQDSLNKVMILGFLINDLERK